MFYLKFDVVLVWLSVISGCYLACMSWLIIDWFSMEKYRVVYLTYSLRLKTISIKVIVILVSKRSFIVVLPDSGLYVRF